MKFGFPIPLINERTLVPTSLNGIANNLGQPINPKVVAHNPIPNRSLAFSVLVLITSLCFAAGAFSQTAVVIAENANLRGTPSSSGKVVVILEQNSGVGIMKQQGAWFLVQAPEFAGWLHGNTIRIEGLDSASALEITPTYATPSPPRSRPSYSETVNRRPVLQSRQYIRGPRGGCYYINSNGNKTYADRSLCN